MAQPLRVALRPNIPALAKPPPSSPPCSPGGLWIKTNPPDTRGLGQTDAAQPQRPIVSFISPCAALSPAPEHARARKHVNVVQLVHGALAGGLQIPRSPPGTRRPAIPGRVAIPSRMKYPQKQRWKRDKQAPFRSLPVTPRSKRQPCHAGSNASLPYFFVRPSPDFRASRNAFSKTAISP